MTNNTDLPIDFPDFSERVAIVTGASGGIGAEIVRRLVRQGSIVAAVDKNANALYSLVMELQREGYKLEAFVADISSSTEVNLLVPDIEKALGPIHYLVNAAGILRSGPVTELSVEDWELTMRMNALSVFLMSRAVAKHMVQSVSKGAIVTVASNAALIARMNMAAYAASKAAAISFTKCLGLEMAQHGIRCNVVAPGSTDTEMLKALWGDSDRTNDTIDGSLNSFRSGIPLKRIALPANVATTVVFLLSEQAAHVTMQTLTVDGGATLGA